MVFVQLNKQKKAVWVTTHPPKRHLKFLQETEVFAKQCCGLYNSGIVVIGRSGEVCLAYYGSCKSLIKN